jgi:hypothetical protein
MRLESADALFELQIRGYQFPVMESEDYDSNWLRIHGTVRHPRGSWTFEDPCLLTYEVAALATWLEQISTNGFADDRIGFIEPNLEFRWFHESGGEILRVYFELESRPAWAPSTSVGELDLWIDFHLGENDLGAAAKSLRNGLAKYPQRAVR